MHFFSCTSLAPVVYWFHMTAQADATATHARFKPAGYAASELDGLHEMIGDVCPWSLPVDVAAMQWDGRVLHVFDAENAARVAAGLSDHANALDQETVEDRRTQSAICRGLWTLASKVRKHYA